MEMYHKDDEVKTVIIIPEQMESRIEIKTNDMFFMEKLNRRCNSLPDDYVRYCHRVDRRTTCGNGKKSAGKIWAQIVFT